MRRRRVGVANVAAPEASSALAGTRAGRLQGRDQVAWPLAVAGSFWLLVLCKNGLMSMTLSVPTVSFFFFSTR